VSEPAATAARTESGDHAVAGQAAHSPILLRWYYTLAYGSVALAEAPPSIRAGLAKYPIPVILLARLAVDVKEKGQGLGAGLLKDALLRTMQAVEIAGLRAMLVHALDDAARAFYEKFGFESSPIDAYHLFLKVSDILASLLP
jgi:predicted N-acetyltransferase YhbS